MGIFRTGTGPCREYGSVSREQRNHHEIELMHRIYVVHRTRPVAVCQGIDCLPVPEHDCRVVPKHIVRTFYRLFPLHAVYIEPCCKGITRKTIEMVLRHAVGLIIKKRQGFRYILFHHFIAVCQSAAGILGIQRRLRLFHIYYSLILVCIVRMIRKTIYHGKAEMSIRTTHQSLSLIWQKFLGLSHILNGLKDCIGCRYGLIVSLP